MWKHFFSFDLSYLLQLRSQSVVDATELSYTDIVAEFFAIAKFSIHRRSSSFARSSSVTWAL